MLITERERGKPRTKRKSGMTSGTATGTAADMTGDLAGDLAMGHAPHIEIRGVGKLYSGVSVLRGVDLDIAPGEVHSLVGENGAGKSTLLNILGGAVRADEGTLRFDGEHVTIATPRDVESSDVCCAAIGTATIIAAASMRKRDVWNMAITPNVEGEQPD